MKQKLKTLLKDDLARKILHFFFQNQGSIDSVGGVSAWVHDDRARVKKILDKLVKLSVLESDSTGSMKGYCYTRDEETMKTVNELMKDV